MIEYGTLTTGQGVSTKFTESWVPQFLQIGDGVTAPDIQGINITAGDKNPITIDIGNNNAPLLDAIFQWGNTVDGNSGDAVYLLEISDGHQGNESLVMTITNDGASTPKVYGYSERTGNRLYTTIGSNTLQASSSKLYNSFSGLAFLDDNFSKATIQFTNGHGEADLDEPTLRTLLSRTGNLPKEVGAGNVIMIDNRMQNIEWIEIYSSSGGTLTVVNVRY